MATVPQAEIGYAQQYSSGYWWMYDGENTPELQWPQSVAVYDQMRTQDSQVKSVLGAVAKPIQATGWRVEPAGARDEVVEFIAENLGLPIVGRGPLPPVARMRDRFSWDEHLQHALLMLPFGYSYFEQLYRVEGGRAWLRKLAPRLPKTIEFVQVAPDGGLEWIRQYATNGGTSPKIPVDRLVAYVNEREGGNWLGRSILRSCYKNWLIKDRLLRVQAQTVERNGMGIPVYEGAEGEKDLTPGRVTATKLRAGDAAGVATPYGAKLRLMGVEGDLPDADKPIRYHDEQIARGVLAHFLNLGTQTGSWALGTTFADFFTLSLQTVARLIADTATKHVVEDLVDANWGSGEAAPRIVHDEIGSHQAATAQAVKLLVDAGVITGDDVLEGALRQQYGLPPRDAATERPRQPASGGVPPEGAETGDLSVAARARHRGPAGQLELPGFTTEVA